MVEFILTAVMVVVSVVILVVFGFLLVAGIVAVVRTLWEDRG